MKTTKKIYLVTGGVLVTNTTYIEPEEVLLYPLIAFDSHAKATQYCTDKGYQPKRDLFIKNDSYRKVEAVAYYPEEI